MFTNKVTSASLRKPSGYKGISYGRITPVLTGAIQEIAKRLIGLPAGNRALKRAVCELNSKAEVSRVYKVLGFCFMGGVLISCLPQGRMHSVL
jgi:hypothetical protein